MKVGKAGISFRSSGNEPWQKPDVVTVDGIVDLASGSQVFSNQPGNEAVIICDKSYPEVIEVQLLLHSDYLFALLLPNFI